jgi:hypothetical protein
MSKGLWRCSCCGEGVTPGRVGRDGFTWGAGGVTHRCKTIDLDAKEGINPCRWFGDGSGYPVFPTDFSPPTQEELKRMKAEMDANPGRLITVPKDQPRPTFPTIAELFQTRDPIVKNILSMWTSGEILYLEQALIVLAVELSRRNQELLEMLIKQKMERPPTFIKSGEGQ